MAKPTIRPPLGQEALLPGESPRILRLQNLARFPNADHTIRNEAHLYHEKATLRVAWVSRQVDTRLRAGSLVSIRWTGNPVTMDGTIHVAGLILLERPVLSENLFDTVPPGWVGERDLVDEARAYWERLPRGYQQLFNAVFWNGLRFQRYVTGPSSLNGHHWETNGNFRHSLEVVRLCLSEAVHVPQASRSLLILAGLLHDAGKADEYRLDRAHGALCLSDRGKLIGHKHTVVDWLAVARACPRVIVPEAHYLALIHCLTATRGAAPWTGWREPLSLEATMLSNADRLSGQANLVGRHAPAGEGFGQYHRHLGGQPYVLGADIFPLGG